MCQSKQCKITIVNIWDFSYIITITKKCAPPLGLENLQKKLVHVYNAHGLLKKNRRRKCKN
jgi:hypothetical protein